MAQTAAPPPTLSTGPWDPSRGTVPTQGVLGVGRISGLPSEPLQARGPRGEVQRGPGIVDGPPGVPPQPCPFLLTSVVGHHHREESYQSDKGLPSPFPQIPHRELTLRLLPPLPPLFFLSSCLSVCLYIHMHAFSPEPCESGRVMHLTPRYGNSGAILSHPHGHLEPAPTSPAKSAMQSTAKSSVARSAPRDATSESLCL